MIKNALRVVLAGAAALAAPALAPSDANAFCGFYVSGGGAKMFNDATQVVMMRAGTRTVFSMQNDYNGPIADFAMVVPVPVVPALVATSRMVWAVLLVSTVPQPLVRFRRYS